MKLNKRESSLAECENALAARGRLISSTVITGIERGKRRDNACGKISPLLSRRDVPRTCVLIYLRFEERYKLLVELLINVNRQAT